MLQTFESVWLHLRFQPWSLLEAGGGDRCMPGQVGGQRSQCRFSTENDWTAPSGQSGKAKGEMAGLSQLMPNSSIVHRGQRQNPFGESRAVGP